MNKITPLIIITIASFALAGCTEQGKTPTAAATPAATPAAPAAPDTASETNTTKVGKTVVYSVKGMSCGGCASAVTTKVNKVDGVMACDVSLEQQQATVELAENGSATDVEEAIRSLGYTVEPESTNPAS
ncbi:MAG: heavy metal-associated domain-containing protein [Phycisphaerales bacterium]|nr:heavy metal-associated domain-containing protein [Phycisphaerales bacterium]